MLLFCVGLVSASWSLCGYTRRLKFDSVQLRMFAPVQLCCVYVTASSALVVSCISLCVGVRLFLLIALESPSPCLVETEWILPGLFFASDLFLVSPHPTDMPPSHLPSSSIDPPSLQYPTLIPFVRTKYVPSQAYYSYPHSSPQGILTSHPHVPSVGPAQASSCRRVHCQGGR
jgi:hypothetical protein